MRLNKPNTPLTIGPVLQTTPICQPVNRKFGLQEVVPAPSLVSFFPCKLCGK